MDVPTETDLADRIDAFLARHDMAPTRFGRDATGNANLLKELKEGKSPSLRTVHRIAAFIAERDAALDLDAAASAARGDKDEELAA